MNVLDRPDWMTRAACRGLPTDLWFPTKGVTENNGTIDELCGSCPVESECLAWGFSTDFVHTYMPVGIFGGVRAKDRQMMYRELNKLVPQCRPHGYSVTTVERKPTSMPVESATDWAELIKPQPLRTRVVTIAPTNCTMCKQPEYECGLCVRHAFERRRSEVAE